MRKGDLRKRELLDAAEKLFFKKGYAATTISDILETQNCSKGSFYHHFESKLQVLTALCAAHAAAAFARYQNACAAQPDPLKKLDMLLYASLPVCPEEADMCALLIPLIGLPEGGEVLASLLSAQKAAFFPELETQLASLRAQGKAFFPCAALPAVIWDAHTGLYRRLLSLGAGMMEKTTPSPQDQAAAQEELDAERYLFERALGLPFGSMTIIGVPVCVETLRYASNRARCARAKET